jgi:hypothetical protein
VTICIVCCYCFECTKFFYRYVFVCYVCTVMFSSLSDEFSHRLNATTGATTTSPVKAHEWVMFGVDIDATEADLVITVTQSDANKDVDVYVRFDG